MAKFELDMEAIRRKALLALEGLLADQFVMRDVLNSCVSIIRPGDTVFLRFSGKITAGEASEIFHRSKPIAERNGFTIAVVDGCDQIYIMRREDYAQSQQHSHEDEEVHPESVPLGPEAPSLSDLDRAGFRLPREPSGPGMAEEPLGSGDDSSAIP